MQYADLKDQSVVVAMSGGVDSAAAAMMLAEQGAKVIGISMQVWDYREGGGSESRATCCAPADFDDAREVATKFDFPYYVFDFEDSFEKSVIQPFVDSYLAGETPNPCLECNRKVKFRELRKRAASLGASRVATGHYAQIKRLSNGSLGLFTGRDKNKDQSYFLYAMSQAELDRTLFPVGGMEKPAVRDYLAEHGISLAEKAESQDICFVGGTVAEFIEKRSGQKQVNGQIVNSDGDAIGEHQGIYNYTVGQRKGLGISHPSPLYVLNIDSKANAVCVGEKESLRKEDFYVENINWIDGGEALAKLGGSMRLRVKLRYRHQGVVCEIKSLANGRAHIKFIDDWSTVSPGQAAVFYDLNSDPEGDIQVLGGGTISSHAS